MSSVFRAFLVVLVSNIPFIFLANYLSVGRPWINIDYAIAFVFFAFGYWWLAVFLTVTFTFFDFFSIATQYFPFIRFFDFFYLVKMLPYVSGKYFFYFLFLLIFLLVNFFIIFFIKNFVGKKLSLASLNVVLILHFLVVYIFYPDPFRNHRKIGDDVYVQSQMEYFLTTRFSGFPEMFRADQSPFEEYTGPAAAQSITVGGDLPNKILLIVAESWGVPRNDAVQNALLEPLRDLQVENWQQGALSFEGATVAAEFRELCGVKLNHFDLREKYENYDKCLPHQLNKKGYVTRSLHGATGNIYDRYFWYPLAGFENTVFFESRNWPRRCYSFPGACDLDLLEEVEGFFESSGKRFMYWLTLNSHSIYDERDIYVDAFDCDEYGFENSESCRNLKLHAQFFDGLAGSLNKSIFEGVKVIIVGDHEPRIMSKEEMDNNFFSGKIPWVSFTLGQ
jgi:hypothetical protein